METPIDSPLWYTLADARHIHSPSLLVYPDRIKENIRRLIAMIGDVTRLRPHIKTCKSAPVVRLMQEAGIVKYKCATIAEAELLGTCQAKDVLLAYQPVGPNIARLIALIQRFPKTQFACLLDHQEVAEALNQAAKEADLRIPVYVDLNVGMDRTGMALDRAPDLCQTCLQLPHLQFMGLHAYDGHIHDPSLTEREQQYKRYYTQVKALQQHVHSRFGAPIKIVAGGTPTFPFHLQEEEVECSPGTFVFWDWGYQTHFREQDFLPAALVLSRVVSIVDQQKICLDLGHKAVASENILTHRVRFLHAPEAVPISQSEEHLVLSVGDSRIYQPGDLFYGIPYHICPTVALHDIAYVIVDHQQQETWDILARKRQLSI